MDKLNLSKAADKFAKTIVGNPQSYSFRVGAHWYEQELINLIKARIDEHTKEIDSKIYAHCHWNISAKTELTILLKYLQESD